MRHRHRRLGAILTASMLLPSCFTMHHTVGRGPQTIGPQQVQGTRWFALFGLWPLNEVDSAKLAGPEATDYRVTTEFTYVDVVISAAASLATIYCQTVIVER